MYRDGYLVDITPGEVGSSAILSGWVDCVRDHGGVIFIDLRDRSGKCQIVVHPESDAYEIAKTIRAEYVVKVTGVVKERARENVNSDIPTGEVEVEPYSIEILNRSAPLPFNISDSNIGEVNRYKYRYLSLRNPKMLNILEKRSEMMRIIRDYLYAYHFLEIDTPILTKTTPEGARDFIVPSRTNRGKFYALPQSPQLFKQILMVGGVDRYFQFAKCFRDEDLRADRQSEFLQLDLEASFVEERDIIAVTEGIIRDLFDRLSGVKIYEIPKMKYDEAINRYGSDKPDIRFNMLLTDISDIAANCGFKVFRDAVESGVVKAINVKQSNDILSRKEIDELTSEISKFGAKGLAWIRVVDGGYSSVISKFFTEEELDTIAERLDAKVGDTLLFVADRLDIVNNSLGFLRSSLAKKLNLHREGFHFVWVTDFPMFEFVDGRYKSVHHPFTAPKGDDLLNSTSRAYDLVLNGVEIAGGSIRIDSFEKQLEVFDILGVENAREKFVHLLEALKYGAPPHGGIALGFDRLLSIITGHESIRDVMPFPKTQKGSCLLTEAPSNIDDSELKELHLRKVLDV